MRLGLPYKGRDHCRIGSLEIKCVNPGYRTIDHCRIGSLEKRTQVVPEVDADHCRIGSLEKAKNSKAARSLRSLPHRQLRKPKESKEM